ncbi:MAG: hypothetical protein ACFHHU_07835 [Porticoccaceae bacterium]
MATDIPPHNLREVVECLSCYCWIILPVPHLMSCWNIVRGPDFPTGGEIISVSSAEIA